MTWSNMPNLRQPRVAVGIFRIQNYLYAFGDETNSHEVYNLNIEPAMWDIIPIQIPQDLKYGEIMMIPNSD